MKNLAQSNSVVKKLSKRNTVSVKAVVEKKMLSEKTLKLRKEQTSIQGSSALRIPESSDTESKSKQSHLSTRQGARTKSDDKILKKPKRAMTTEKNSIEQINNEIEASAFYKPMQLKDYEAMVEFSSNSSQNSPTERERQKI